MVILPASIGAAVGSQLPAFFNDAFEQFRQGEGGYIRDGEPEGVIAQIGQGVARAACRRYGEVLPTLPDGREERYERACRPYLDSLEPGNGIGFASPFNGGQCDGLAYLVTLNWQVPGGTPPTQSTGFVARGPIQGVSLVDVSGGKRVRVTARSNPQLSFTCTTPQPLGPPTTYTLGAPAIDSRAEGLTVAITPCGFSDSCGNPPPEVTQPTGQPDPTPPPFRFNPDRPGLPPIDIPINIEFNPDGTINVDFGGEPFPVDPFPPEGDGGGGGGGGNQPVAGDPGESEDTGTGSGAGQVGEAEGEAPEGKVLTGVRIDIVETPSSRSRFTLDVDRGVAYVYMGTQTEGLGLEPTGALVRTGQFFFAQKDYLTSWAVRAKPGYNLRTTPYYKDAPE